MRTLYLPNYTVTSADSALVVADLKSGPCTFLLTCTVTSGDSTLVVAELVEADI